MAEAPLADLPALLDKHCHTDEVRREVERALSTLHDDESLSGFLDTPAIASAPSPLVDSDLDSHVVGRRIGRYTLVRTIGEGGMGTVYEARQENPRRSVALKVLKGGVFTPGALRRFERESAVLGMLHHPGIAQVYEAGVEITPIGRVPFFAMELVNGVPLDTFVRTRGPDTDTILEIMARVCDAVHHAHTNGVVHRDLKPGNILVDEGAADGSGSRYGEGTGSGVHAAGPSPKILDFGVARVTNAEAGLTTTAHTEAGQIVGTLTYMSPEQVTTRYGPVGPRTDVYAMGVILYELLAGRAPLDVRSRTLPEATNIILQEEPLRLRRVTRRIHEDVDTIVAKAMDKDPKRRYPSAAELAMDLRRFRRKEPISARPATTVYQIRRFAARNRTLVSGVVATLLALAMGLAGTIVFARRERAQREIAQQRLAESELKSYQSNIRAAQAALLNNEATLARLSLDSAPPGMRGWEWEHLDWTLTRGSLTISPPTPDGQCCITTHGQSLLVATGDVTRIDLETGRSEIAIPRPGRAKAVRAYASPDGRYLNIRSGIKGAYKLEIWDLSTRQLLREYDRQDVGICFLDSRPLLATAEPQGMSSITDALTGEKLGVQDSSSPLLEVSLPDGTTARYASCGSTSRYRRISDTAELIRPVFPNWCVSPDGRFISVYENNPRGRTVYRIEDGSKVGTFVAGGEITSQVFHPTRPELTIGSSLGLLEVWDLLSMSRRLTLPTRGIVTHLLYSADGRWLLCPEQDGSVRRWDAALSGSPWTISLGPTLALSPDASRMICRYWGPVRCWDTQTGQLSWTCFLGQSYANCGAFSPDGSMLALGPLSHVAFLDPGSGKVLSRSNALETSRLLSMAFSPDAKSLFVGCGDGSIARLSAADNWTTPVTIPARHASPVIALAVSPDGRWGASASGEGKNFQDVLVYPGSGDAGVRLWGTDDGAQVRLLGVRPPRVSDLKFSEDGRELYAAAMDGDLIAWSIPDGEKLWEMRVSDNGLTSIDISGDGRRFIVGEFLGSVHLIDRATRAPVYLPRVAPGYCSFARFTPDGRSLVATPGTNLVRYETGLPSGGPWARERSRRARAILDGLPGDLPIEDRLELARRRIAESPPDADDVEQMVRTDGEQPTFMINTAFLLSLEPGGKPESYEKAVRYARRCTELLPANDYYQDTLALTLFRAGRLTEALATNDAVARTSVADASAMHHWVRAMILFRLGDSPGAARAAELARTLMSAPQNAEFAANRQLMVEATALLAGAAAPRPPEPAPR